MLKTLYNACIVICIFLKRTEGNHVVRRNPSVWHTQHVKCDTDYGDGKQWLQRKKLKHSIKIVFKEPKKNEEMLCSRFEEKICQKKSVLAHSWRKKELIKRSVCYLESTIFELFTFFIIKYPTYSPELQATLNVYIITKDKLH